MTREELADALEQRATWDDDAVLLAFIDDNLPAILSALRGPAHDEAVLNAAHDALAAMIEVQADGNMQALSDASGKLSAALSAAP